MKKILKITAWALGVLFVLLLAAAIIIPLLYKDQIKAVVQDEINNNVEAKVAFHSVNLSLIRNFPNFTFSLNDLSVVNNAPFEGDTLASIGQFRLVLNLQSVVRFLQDDGQLELRSISLNNPRIHVQVLDDGTANWDIAKAEEAEPKEAEEDPETSDEATAFDIGLKSFTINNAHIVYDDASLGFYTSLEHFNHSLSGDFTQDEFTMNTTTTADRWYMSYGGVPYLNNVALDFDADLGMDMVNSKYTFRNNEIRINALALGFDGYYQMNENSDEMDISFEAKETAFKHILSLVPAIYAKDFESLETKGKMALNGFVKGVMSDDQMPAYALNLSINDAMFNYPDMPDAVNNVNVQTEVNNPDGNPDKTVVKVSKCHLEFGEEPFDFTLLLKTPISDPYVDATMKGKVDLENMQRIMPMEDVTLKGIIESDVATKGFYSAIEQERYADFHAAGRVTVRDMAYQTDDYPHIQIKEMLLTFRPADLALENFDAKLGRSDLRASGAFDNYLGYYLNEEMLRGRFDIQSKHFDTNEWMTEGDAEATTDAPDTPDPEDEVPLAVFEVPENIDFTMSAVFDELIYDNMQLEQVRGRIDVRDRTVRLTNLRMNTLDGTLVMSGSYDTKAVKAPAFDFDLDIQNMDIQKSFKTFNTIQKLAPVAEYAHGDFSTRMGIRGILDQEMMPVYETLNGRGILILDNVVVKNLKPLSRMATQLKMEQYKELRLQRTQPSFKIVDGRVEVDPFDIQAGKTKMNVSGHNTIDQKINYLVKMDVPREEMGDQASAFIGGLADQAADFGLDAGVDIIKLDVNITGTMDEPKIGVGFRGGEGKSVKDQVKDKVEEKVKEEVDKVKEEAKEKVAEEVDKAKEKAKEEAEQKARQILAEAEKKAERVRQEGKKQADRVRKEGDRKADKVVREAGSNPLKKRAAQEAAKKIRQEANSKADKIEREANQKADRIMKEAREQADKVRKDY